MARILIAEDDDSMRHFLGRALLRAGHEVIAVGNGDDALTLVKESRFQLLLCDIVMPGLDGIELAKRAGQLDPDLKMLFITGFTAVAPHPVDGDRPMAHVLPKPFHLRELVEEVDRALGVAAEPGGAPG